MWCEEMQERHAELHAQNRLFREIPHAAASPLLCLLSPLLLSIHARLTFRSTESLRPLSDAVSLSRCSRDDEEGISCVSGVSTSAHANAGERHQTLIITTARAECNIPVEETDSSEPHASRAKSSLIIESV